MLLRDYFEIVCPPFVSAVLRSLSENVNYCYIVVQACKMHGTRGGGINMVWYSVLCKRLAHCVDASYVYFA